MVKIVQKSDPILRETAKDVLVSDIQTPKIQKILKDMKEALASQEDGVAIAAPQIGESLRIFVISGKVFEIIKLKKSRNQKCKTKKYHSFFLALQSFRYLY